MAAMLLIRSFHIPGFLLLTACFGLLFCSPTEEDVLARYRNGQVTVAELDRHIRLQPEALRQIPENIAEAEWYENQLKRLVIKRLLGETDEMRREIDAPGWQAAKRWALIQALAKGIHNQMAAKSLPGEEAILARMERLQAENPIEDLLNFRHIYFRLDQAKGEEERSKTREIAASVAERAKNGADFASLVRTHSQSADAAKGGLVQNNRLADLDPLLAKSLADLEEGDVAPLIETRTGLHIVKLERRVRPKRTSAQARQTARALLAQERFHEVRRELLEALRKKTLIQSEHFPWSVGSWSVSESDVAQYHAGDGPLQEAQKEHIVELLLLAEEAKQRDLLSETLANKIYSGQREAALQRVYHERLTAFLAELPAARFRAIYDASPSAFAAKEAALLDLIWISREEGDNFKTQQWLEKEVALLRRGASFEDLARNISTGPNASGGGDLGFLSPRDWARLNPAIYETVLKLRAGDISNPIYCTERILTSDSRTLSGGFAILRVRRKRPPKQRNFQEALEDVRHAYMQQNARQLEREFQKILLREIDFEILRLPRADEFLP